VKVIDFLEERFSRYPFSTGGGIVDDDNLLFALETQTRPVYSKYFFTSPPNGDPVVVHELAHQWFGDGVALAEWKHIWLNEGLATYAEWMWSEEEGLGTAQEQFEPSTTGSRPTTRSGAW
jgi:aminopeptidase N